MRTIPRQVRRLKITDVTEHILHCTWFARAHRSIPRSLPRIRNAVLEASGAKPTDDIVRDFLGRPYSFKAYEEWLDGN